jgi:membrane dipeptidase
MLMIDGHLDLAWNALDWRRDLTRSVAELRAAEGKTSGEGRGSNTVALPEMRQAEIAIAVVTLFAGVSPTGQLSGGYPCPEIAYAAAQGQLAYYRALEREGKVRLIHDWPALETAFSSWENRIIPDPPFGFILGMEGADPIVSPDQLPEWWRDGLRIVVLSPSGMSAYAHGTGSRGGLTARGRLLMADMEKLQMILDVTHLSDDSFWEALEVFGGSVLASHQCCRALVCGDRQFSDEQIRTLVQRDAVIGVASNIWMLCPGSIVQTRPEAATMGAIVDHIDHVCQVAGSARHAAIGSDLDGGWGTEQAPRDLNTIADLQQLSALLTARGYQESDIRAIMHGNWLRLFQRTWA